ncbi:MAG: T9SS type A sorting domain-containing protein [Sporocytophaga sp.]|uniref:T9SS type A sorting domain-containing protein n=1 Tax=Sporocytophaga sp. TaxID=2231183 RepID=UPI001B1691D7|nr:T9SS type A sorting domain-containing protein [Sporocytophaga sp.]MBO9699706.1 T9SS type A sorting domain-containing protein [Sporocytophaga sp.]
MIKNYRIRLIFFILIIFHSSLVFSQTTLGLYQFTGNTCASPKFGVTTQPAYATFGNLTTNLICNEAANKYLSSNWSMNNSGPSNTYVQFSLTANSETNLIISGIKYTRYRSATGPGAVILKYSTDGVNFSDYATTVDSVKTTSSRKSLTKSIITEKGATLTFRLYGWLATDAAGQLSLDEIEVLGTILTGPITFYSQASGNSNASIWATSVTGTKIPAVFNSENSFVIQTGHSVKALNNIVAKDLSIASTGKLYAGSATEFSVTLYGNLVVNGNFGNGASASDKLTLKTINNATITGTGIFHTYGLQNSGTLSVGLPTYIQGSLVSSQPVNFNNYPVTFKSPSSPYEAQYISGSPLTVKNIYISNSVGVTNQTSITITGVLNLTSGTFNTSNNVILDLNTGYISRFGTGTLSGKIKIKKNISGNEPGYHHVSFPLTNVTLSELADNATLEKGGYSWIYTYNEADKHPSIDSGWVAVSGLSTPLVNTTGYTFYFNKPTSLDLSGNFVNTSSPVKFNVTNTNSGDSQSDGWNLIGNPFPYPISWVQDTGWSKTNVTNAIYIWDTKANKYRTYINGASLNGGSPVIPSMQAFFIKASTGLKPTLSVNRKAFTNLSNPAVTRTEVVSSGLKLSVSSNIGSDETLIRLSTEADTSFNEEFDAYKLLNSGNCPSIFTQLNGIDYAVNSIPDEFNSVEIPLVIAAASAGNYLISASDLSSIGEDYNISLTDKQFEKTQNLRTNPNYSTYINQNENPERFYLTLEKARTDVVTGVNGNTAQNLSLYCFDKKIFFNLPESVNSSLSLSISDVSGNQLLSNKELTVDGSTAVYNVENLKPGMYLVSVFDGQKFVTKKIILY